MSIFFTFFFVGRRCVSIFQTEIMWFSSLFHVFSSVFFELCVLFFLYFRLAYVSQRGEQMMILQGVERGVKKKRGEILEKSSIFKQKSFFIVSACILKNRAGF